MVLHRHRHGLERNGTIARLDCLLEIEILDGEVVVAIFVGAPHRGEIRLAHGVTHGVLFREVTTGGLYGAVDQKCRVVRSSGKSRRVAVIFFLEFGDEFLVGVVGQIVYPMIGARYSNRDILQARYR